MEKTLRKLSIIIGIIVIVCFIGSFPVRHYFGQEYCDLMRIIGLVMLVINFILDYFAKKQR